MKTSVGFIALIIAIAATLITQTVHAQAVRTVVMTEESSSVLDVMFTGTPLPAADIQNTSPDHWTVTLPSTVIPLSGAPGVVWLEPTSTDYNLLSWTSPNQLSIVSDTSAPLGAAVAGVNGSPFSGGGALDAIYTFNDNGDVPSAHDTGTTFGLLALALAALFGASRFRALRLA